MSSHDWVLYPPLAIVGAGLLLAVTGIPSLGCLLTFLGILLFAWVINRNTTLYR